MDCLPWIIKSDFNETLSSNDKLGGSDKTVSSMIALREVLLDCDISDLWCSGTRFTWTNHRKSNANVYECLDRFLAYPNWRDPFVDARVDNLGFNISYHRPILLSFKEGFKCEVLYKKCFKIEPF